MIFKLPTFEESTTLLLCQHYFYQQEHFNIENFLYQLISKPTSAVTDDELLATNNNVERKPNNINIKKKLMIFTRTSSSVISLNEQSKNDLFLKNNRHDVMTHISDKVDIINLAIIENSIELQEPVRAFEQSNDKSILIVVIDGRINQQRMHIPFVRQLLDKTELSCNQTPDKPSKFFIILMHSSGQELDYKSAFPSIFLNDWDYWFLDTSTPGSSFHLQKMLQIFTSKIGITHQREAVDNALCDLNILFDDCLFDFVSRLQINIIKLADDMFINQNASEFYQRQTSNYRRVQCLKTIFQQLNELQKHIISCYHENVSMKEDSLRKNCNSIYDLAKDTLCGKHFYGLVDSLHSRMRLSFTNFASFILKFIVDDYGLESLTKLSNKNDDYGKLLELIDYSSFSFDNETQTTPMMQRILTLNDHYGCIPQTPLFYLFRQRIKNLADEIKSRLADQQNEVQNGLEFDNFDPQAPAPALQPLPTTTTRNKVYGVKNEPDNTREQFCNQLIQSIANDKILSKIISASILQSYANDLIRILSTIIEKNFHDSQKQCQKTIDFVCRWLLLVDENEKESFNSSFNHHIWQLAHVYASIEYDENDLLSLYSACRIAEDIDPNQSFYQDLLAEENISRSKVRENLFQLMFLRLWTNLCHLCETNEDTKKWIQSYSLISKYYPSDKVLKRVKFVQMKVNIEFMSLVYLILLNVKTPQPIKLIQNLLKDTSLIQDGATDQHRNLEESSCLKLLPTIIQTIDQYFKENNANNGTLMMDIQQWILATLKVSKGSSYQEIISLLKFLNQPTCHLSLPMKQLLFDELIKILIGISQQKRLNVPQQQFIDAWDRVSFLSVMTECMGDETLENYQIPYHTSVINNTNQNHLLMDLLFFHLRRLVNNQQIQPSFINKILLSNLPRINDANRVAIADKVFKQLKDYFILLTTALLLCQPDLDIEDQQKINQIIGTVIDQYLIIPTSFVQLSKNLELFFSVIVMKKSWDFLLDLLRSKRIQDANAAWANVLHDLFTEKSVQQPKKHQNLYYQVQFTLSTDNTESIFPALHVPYDELNQLINECINNNDVAKRWIPLTDWITSKLNSDPPLVNATEIKVMLLLNIYYVYYCNARLNSLDNLLTIIEDKLQPCDEEQRVFRAFLQPEKHMIGYPNENNVKDNNYLNDLFKIDFKDDEQLPIRHTLVNLLVMILLGGKENTLWMFAFEPLKLEGTHGFASTATSPITRNGVHYDCGCVLSENGGLEQLHGGNEFSIPAVYIAFFATFGAMAWHLLLYESSVGNLCHPILAKHAINPTADLAGISKDSIRARTCYFVCTRLLSTNIFLQLQMNQDDVCLLFNRCFELFAQHTRQLDRNPWIKPLYKTNIEKLEAEKEFRNKIFYPTNNKMADYKQIINNLQSQSEPQTRLLDYVAKMSIIIEVIHFKTELCNPESSQLPLTILRRLLDSFEFLKMIRYIYALSQFHVLIHRTFTRLIEQNEFHTITLKELYERASQLSNRLRQPNQQDKYYKIIEKGIEAVNTYHSFANGQIRPGACDITQHFEPISMDTPISYLVETDSYDEGDIIMRILSVLVNYHNNLLGLLGTEIERNGDTLGLGPLKDILKELLEREISILQIVHENMGTITLNQDDCQWIEKLSCASLENEKDYFLKLNTPLKFNFLYVQSNLVRTYLLYCHINYQHIKGKYQCYIQRKSQGTANAIEIDDDIDMDSLNRLTDEWNHLEQKSLGQLQNEFNFLQRIIDILKDASEDHSTESLSEFIRTTNYDDRFAEQFEQYEMKDFSLSQIKLVCRLYEQSINRYQHAFINVSQLLRVPLDKIHNDELDRMLKLSFIPSNDEIKKEEFQDRIEKITEFLSDVKNEERFIETEWTKSFSETCNILCIESPIVQFIPLEIKCENYVPLCLKFIEIRSQLQERMINIEEKTVKLWSARFDIPDTARSKENSFLIFRNKDDDFVDLNPNSRPPLDRQQSLVVDSQSPSTNPIDWWQLADLPSASAESMNPANVPPGTVYEETILYTPIFKLKVKSIPLPPSALFENTQTKAEQLKSNSSNARYTITFKDGKQLKYHTRPERFYAQLKKSFDEKKYEMNKICFIDPNQVLLDFTKVNDNDQLPIIESEYRVMEKDLLPM
ncbi:unnamed protein product [Rotaria socialis]